MRYLLLISISFIATFFFGGCLKPPEYPAIPEISFNQISLNNATNIVTIKINFKDGNGDIGLNTDETDLIYRLGDSIGTSKPRTFKYNPYNKNYWVDIYILKKGVYKYLKFITTDPTYNFYDFDGIVPIVSESSLKNQTAIEGFIDYDMDFSQATTSSTSPALTLANDTLKFKIRLLDRKLNISDTVETSPIVLFPK